MSGQKTFFVKDEQGSISHVVKYLRPAQKEVYEALQALNDPHVPKVFCIGEKDDVCCAEYEFIPGNSLEDVSGMDDEELLRVALDITQALCCIHSNDPPIVHRDIKPGNIVHRSHGGYALIDFDAARLYRDDMNRDTMLDGTPGYAPPEQMGYMQTDARSDIYALGATLYELKTGCPYHAGDICPGKLQHIIKKCTMFAPEGRYRNVFALKRALLRIKGRFVQRLLLPAISLGLGVVIGLCVPEQMPQRREASGECVCRLDQSQLRLSTAGEELIEIGPGEEVKTELVLHAPMSDAELCTAINHIQPELVGVRLKRCTLGGEAAVDENGQITLYREGVYEFDAMITCGGDYYGPISTTVIAAEDLSAYTDCRCVFDIYQVDYIQPEYQLPDDGSPVEIDLKFREPVIDDRMCESDVHAQLLYMPAGWLSAPEGSDVYVDEQNILRTTTPGHYQLDIPMWFRMREEDSFHFDILIK